ncbi:hypothetical protein [Gordonia sp. WA4-43]|uniref:hypothetical protein n=1 Tax=Gordonia sp. WA4-43 TaxID=2878678 RepID=UPI001CF97D4E|nr:hypothetical protein [Gordonia sp. WA4-43]UCZ89849.1 hypothetical protein LEL84_23070 [Gordonia sp. WA4-43]
MNIFLDENVNNKMVKPLRMLFPAHQFLVAGVDTDKGEDDIPLFPIARDLGADLFLTGDIDQLDELARPGERTACRDAGLHWLGLPKVAARGRLSLYGEFSVLVGALAYVIDDASVASEPTFFVLKKGPRNRDEIALADCGPL